MDTLEMRVLRLEEAVAKLAEQVSELTEISGARNRSAPLKKNMTDQDAYAVLTGDQKDMKHLEAADALGLTYAQVYSCRKGFTFKHVHKELKSAGFKNPHPAPVKQGK